MKRIETPMKDKITIPMRISNNLYKKVINKVNKKCNERL